MSASEELNGSLYIASCVQEGLVCFITLETHGH